MAPIALFNSAAPEKRNLSEEVAKTERAGQQAKFLEEQLALAARRRQWSKLHALAVILGDMQRPTSSLEASTSGVDSTPTKWEAAPAEQSLHLKASMRIDHSLSGVVPSLAARTPERQQPVTIGERVQALRKGVWDLFSEPESSSAAVCMSFFILFLILLSSTTFCLETMAEFHTPNAEAAFYVIELICIAAFSIEYVLRLLCCPKLLPFIVNGMNLVDMVAILPFYVEMLSSAGGGLGDTRILRIVRLVRVFRVLKLGARFSKMQVVVKAVTESVDMLGMLMFLLLLSMILFSSLVYFCEKGAVPAGEEDPFRSIPASFWWCIVTLMTVGYGDAVPVTVGGKLVASLTMLSSIIILALPISVIGANFTQQWIIFKDEEKMKLQAVSLKPSFLAMVKALWVHNCVMQETLREIREIEKLLGGTMSALRKELALHSGDDLFTLDERKEGGGHGKEWRDREAHIDELFRYCAILRAMLVERMKKMQLMSSEEFGNLMQLCQKLQKTAARKVDEGKVICEQAERVQREVESIRLMFFDHPAA